jgi:outer membrane murein-binding lipoprotein Lpp
MFKRVFLAGVFAIVLWLGLLSNTASSQQVESRINNLESDLNRVQLQLNQIQYQIGQTRQLPSPRTTLTPRTANGSSRNLSPAERDRMFDRLATLVVELKQQVSKLETRVSKLESR